MTKPNFYLLKLDLLIRNLLYDVKSKNAVYLLSTRTGIDWQLAI
jgi:hypothetical protein